jgi:hypothetical protein
MRRLPLEVKYIVFLCGDLITDDIPWLDVVGFGVRVDYGDECSLEVTLLRRRLLLYAEQGPEDLTLLG